MAMRYFVTIIASGPALLWAMGGAQGLGPWFMVKMLAVVVWVAGYVLMRLSDSHVPH